MDDIDAMFSDLLGEIDLLTQSLGPETEPLVPKPLPSNNQGVSLSFGFTDLNESLHELEDNDLDALMADLNAAEQKLAMEIQDRPSPPPPDLSSVPSSSSSSSFSFTSSTSPKSSAGSSVSGRASAATSPLPPPPLQSSKPSMEEIEAQLKADKIKLALEKLKEAKVKKLVVKVLLNDGSSKTLMVDERQTVRDVLDNLFEKTHCDCNENWSLCETNPELHLDRTFEDHENLVEPLLAWTRDSENKILFQERPEKNEVFKNPQNFYLWKKNRKALKEMKDKDKELLIQENFCGTSIIVPDLEAVFYLKEDGKKSWKQRLFQLRASGIYYVPKGKTKSSRDLVCFLQFDNLNVYYGKDFKSKYKAPTDFCLVLKHPQIQKESQYIKYLCCDDAWTLNLWVTGIRIAKYGVSLYENYKTAVRKAAVSSAWANRSTPSGSNPSTPSPTIKTKSPNQANGHTPKPQPGPASKDVGSALPPPPPPLAEILPPPPPNPVLPPPPPPLAANSSLRPAAPQRHLPTNFSPPPPAMDNLPPPPLAPPIEDALEDPPDFLPPPPPSVGFASLPPPPPVSSFPPPPPPATNEFLPPPPPDPTQSVFTSSGAPPPPPPPPPAGAAAAPRAAIKPSGSVRKGPPAPPKRTTPSLQGGGGGGGGGEGDFMSELMMAMNKKRGDH